MAIVVVNVGGSAKLGVSLNGDTIYDLEGEGFSLSASVRKFGLEASTSNLDDLSRGINMYSVSYGISVAPADINITASKTRTMWSFNIRNTVEKVWGKVVSWFK